MNRYEITKVIMRTRSATVFEAIDKDGGGKVAIKAGNYQGSQVENEIEMLKLVNEDESVRPLDSFQSEDNTSCLVLPLATGGDMLQYICQNDAISENVCRVIFARTLSSLKGMHSRRIWHRDIKPDNFLLLKPLKTGEEVVLTDFGLARYSRDFDTSIDMVESFHMFMAPELCRHAPWNEKVDIWALGITMFMCLTCEIPFSSSSDQAVIRKECLEGMPEVIRMLKLGDDYPNLSSEVRNLLIEMLQVEPRERISASDALNSKWFQTASIDEPDWFDDVL